MEPNPLEGERIRPLLRREYDRMVELGMFEDEPIELLRGQLVYMTPQGGPHSDITGRIFHLLAQQLDFDAFDMRAHSPYAATDDSEPEPDVSVSRRARGGEHPDRALLLVEVAERSLRRDRKIKAPIYAENGAPEYWIVDVAARRVHIYTEPRGGAYTKHVEADADAVVELTQLPGITVAFSRVFAGL